MKKQDLNELRKRAKAILGSEENSYSENFDDELSAALHELRTHQIELELQNENLRRTQEQLLETRDQYVDLYDYAPVGYLTLSDKNLILEANMTLSGLLGEDRVSLLGRPLSHFIVPEDQDIFYKKLRELTDTQKRHSCELRMLRKDGDWFWAKLECVPRENIDRSGILIRIALNDITEPKRLEAEIIKAKKIEATAILAGGIAHDFNNLLAVILGNLEMAQKDRTISRPVADKLRNALTACLSAANLTKKFLTFSSGGYPHKKLTSIKTLISDSVCLALAGSNVNYDCSYSDNLWPVEIDAGQMTQTINNVITNSREAMPQGG
ncbi:MAG: PAS domain S-box protein [Proteobacteria bacterium]|nr:PAS domain S-box protein [Pseudomonadota bacterium]